MPELKSDPPFRIKPVDSALRQAVMRAADAGVAVTRWLDEASTPNGDFDVLALGKAAAPMMLAAQRSPRLRTRNALAVCPPEHAASLAGKGVEAMSADHPIPTERNLGAAEAVAAFVSRPGPPLLVLLSGGASAHLASPRPPLGLAELRTLTAALLASGASISQINTVRKHLERLKGGGLAKLAGSRPVRVGVVCDVISGDLAAVSSGPFVPERSTAADAMQIMQAHDLVSAHPAASAVLSDIDAGRAPGAPAPDHPAFAAVTHTLIADNKAAVDAALSVASVQGWACRAAYGVTGDAEAQGRRLAREAISLGQRHEGKPAAAIIGGETTVVLPPDAGRGGRNQHLAAACLHEWASLGVTRAAVFTIATDGVDGSTDSAGVCCAAGLLSMAELAESLRRADTYTLFQGVGAHVVTGPSGTNVNDVAVGLVW